MEIEIQQALDFLSSAGPWAITGLALLLAYWSGLLNSLKGVIDALASHAYKNNSISQEQKDTSDRIEAKIEKIISNDLSHVEEKLDKLISLSKQENRTLDRIEGNQKGQIEKLNTIRRLVNGE